MMSIFASLLSSASGILVVLGVLAGSFGLGMFEEHKIGVGQIDKLKLEYAQAQAKAIADAAAQQKRFDTLAVGSAQAEGAKQASIVTLSRKQQLEIPHYVPVIRACVPVGLVRVLHAAATGVSTADVPLAPGKSDDACSAAGWPDLARAIVADFGTSRQNATQLDALIDFMRKAKGAS